MQIWKKNHISENMSPVFFTDVTSSNNLCVQMCRVMTHILSASADHKKPNSKWRQEKWETINCATNTHTHTLHTAEWCFGIIMPGSGGKLHWSLYWCCSHSGLYFPLWSKHTLTGCHYCPPLSIRSHLKLFRCRETTALNSLSACCCQSAASPTPCLLLLK